MSERWTTLGVLDWTTGRFERAGIEGARLDAQVLLAHVLKCQRVALYTSFDRPLEDGELATYRALIQRRLQGEPVAYLTGRKEFWSLSFTVDARVLIPRPDTETLVQLALELGDGLEPKPGSLALAEVATGSGAIAVSLAHERPAWKIIATDLSQDALDVAKNNALANGVGERIEFRHGHLLAPLAGQRFSMLVSNLPYVSEEEMRGLSKEVLHEPHSALLGGSSGLELIEELIAGVSSLLTPGGWVALEHGASQASGVSNLASAAGFVDVQTRKDLAGRARVTYFRRAPGT